MGAQNPQMEGGGLGAIRMDIRIDTKFFNHPKTMKLYRRLGAEGVLSLIRLWLWTAENRPTGYLHGLDEEDIDLIASADLVRSDQTGTGQVSFCSQAKELGWIDVGEDGVLRLHEWADYNPWAADAPNRSDKARFSKLASVAPAAYLQMVQDGRTSITAEEYRAVVASMPTTKRQRTDGEPTAKDNGRSAPSPSPSPSPNIDRSDPPGEKSLSALLRPYMDTGEKSLNTLLKTYRQFPGYRAELEVKERAWLQGIIARFSGLDIIEELEKAKNWIALKEGFEVKNSRAYIVKWLERVQKERS